MLIDMKDIVINMLKFSWPMIVISIVILVSLRVTYLIIQKEKPVLYKDLLTLFFIIYILCLFQSVTYQDINYGGANYIPFREIFRYDIGSYLFYKNIFGNMLLFLPFGILVGYFLKAKKVTTAIILSFIASCSIEITQLYIGRVFDVDDIILNVCGGLLGYLFYKFLEKIKDIFPEKLKKEWILDILMIIFISIVMRLLLI